MESIPKASLDQILAIISPESQRMLDQKVSDVHLDMVARELVDWESVCTKLGISEAEEGAIKEENQRADGRRYVDFPLLKVDACIMSQRVLWVHIQL